MGFALHMRASLIAPTYALLLAASSAWPAGIHPMPHIDTQQILSTFAAPPRCTPAAIRRAHDDRVVPSLIGCPYTAVSVYLKEFFNPITFVYAPASYSAGIISSQTLDAGEPYSPSTRPFTVSISNGILVPTPSTAVATPPTDASPPPPVASTSSKPPPPAASTTDNPPPAIANAPQQHKKPGRHQPQQNTNTDLPITNLEPQPQPIQPPDARPTLGQWIHQHLTLIFSGVGIAFIALIGVMAALLLRPSDKLRRSQLPPAFQVRFEPGMARLDADGPLVLTPKLTIGIEFESGPVTNSAIEILERTWHDR